MILDKNHFTVSELNFRLKNILESSFDNIFVTGEISNFHNHPSSGHMYFTLKDDNGEWKVRDGYTTEYVDSFFQSKNFRTYFDRKFYPTYKIDQCNFFNGKYYYPETYTKNPMLDGKWFIKPSKGASGKDIVVTDKLSSTDFKDVIYQKPVENILLYNEKIHYI